MNKENDEHVVRYYQENEKMMILIYAQWCINNRINPKELYKQAYPAQIASSILDEVMESTVPKSESEDITTETVLQVLQVFGNDDLAFAVQAVQEEIEKKPNVK